MLVNNFIYSLPFLQITCRQTRPFYEYFYKSVCMSTFLDPLYSHLNMVRGQRPLPHWLDAKLANHNDLLDWLTDLQLLKSTQQCAACHTAMKRIKRRTSIDKYVW